MVIDRRPRDYRRLADRRRLRVQPQRHAGRSRKLLPLARAGRASVQPVKRNAFSLIELLVVIAIIAILSALAAAGLGHVSRSSNLAGAAQRVADQLALARQAAATRNLPVEVRFYHLPDWDAAEDANAEYWRAVQSFVRDGTSITPLARPVLLSQRVAINTDAAASPIWSSMATGTGELAGFGQRPFHSLTIRPNGMVENVQPDANLSFLTLHHENDPPTNGVLPANFVTVQINPVTGKVTVLRP